ncbi:MAG: hypothetical protein ACO3PD_11785 [Acidimicrobiales bacterium]
MPTVIDQVKSAAYTSVGLNLLLTDAVVGREVATPKQFADRASIARTQAADALTDLRGRTEPVVAKITDRLPEQIGDAVQTGRNAVWNFIGIEAPAQAPVPAPAAKAPAKKAANKAAKKTAAKKTAAKKAG